MDLLAFLDEQWESHNTFERPKTASPPAAQQGAGGRLPKLAHSLSVGSSPRTSSRSSGSLPQVGRANRRHTVAETLTSIAEQPTSLPVPTEETNQPSLRDLRKVVSAGAAVGQDHGTSSQRAEHLSHFAPAAEGVVVKSAEQFPDGVDVNVAEGRSAELFLPSEDQLPETDASSASQEDMKEARGSFSSDVDTEVRSPPGSDEISLIALPYTSESGEVQGARFFQDRANVEKPAARRYTAGLGPAPPLVTGLILLCAPIWLPVLAIFFLPLVFAWALIAGASMVTTAAMGMFNRLLVRPFLKRRLSSRYH